MKRMKPLFALALCLAALVLVVLAPGAGAGNGADGSTYVLFGFDGTTLVGVNDQNRSFVAQFSATNFKAAQLDKYNPTDPFEVACGQAAASYNDALTVNSDSGLTSAISSMVVFGCKARVVTTSPLQPGDPYRIKSFQPVP